MSLLIVVKFRPENEHVHWGGLKLDVAPFFVKCVAWQAFLRDTQTLMMTQIKNNYRAPVFGLYGRREYEGAVLNPVFDLKTFAPLVEGVWGAEPPTIVKGKLMPSLESFKRIYIPTGFGLPSSQVGLANAKRASPFIGRGLGDPIIINRTNRDCENS
jgi:hypothetical protein